MEAKSALGFRISPDMQIPTSRLLQESPLCIQGPYLPRHPALGVDDLAQPTDTTALDRYPYSKRFMTCMFTLVKEGSCPLGFAFLLGFREAPSAPSITKPAGPTATHMNPDSGLHHHLSVLIRS
jgi:hypothetical protein